MIESIIEALITVSALPHCNINVENEKIVAKAKNGYRILVSYKTSKNILLKSKKIAIDEKYLIADNKFKANINFLIDKADNFKIGIIEEE